MLKNPSTETVVGVDVKPEDCRVDFQNSPLEVLGQACGGHDEQCWVDTPRVSVRADTVDEPGLKAVEIDAENDIHGPRILHLVRSNTCSCKILGFVEMPRVRVPRPL